MILTESVFLELYSQLKKMRFSGMAEELKTQYEDPNISLLSADERIKRLIEAESETRNTKKLNRIITAAEFRYPSAVLDYELAARQGADPDALERLAECRWIENGKNLMITGPTGAGKSYLACALGIMAATRFMSVRYERAGRLLRKLAQAEESLELTEVLNRYTKYDLLIIDDFGLMNLDASVCRNLFELADSREGNKSTILVSQIPVSGWYSLFKENTYADASLDRLTKGSLRLTLNGASLRGEKDD